MTVLIAGGGVAGGAAACLLGERATVVERERAPHHKVCGEFVSWEAQDALARLGLDAPGLGGVPIGAVRLVHGGRTATARLPRAGLGLSRLVMDEALLRQAAARGARVLRGHAVRRVVPGGLEVQGLGVLPAERVLLATGKHDLHGSRRQAGPGPLVGFKMHYRLVPAVAAAVAGHVEVVLFPGGYAGLQCVEGGVANLCLLIRRELARDGWDGVLRHLAATCPHLAARLDGAVAQWPRPLSVAGVPYGFVHRPAAGDPAHLRRLGDQMGVIPSFSGDGMAVALHTAFAAAGTVDAAVFHTRMRRDLAGQIGRAMLLHRAGQAMPGVVATALRAWPGAMVWVARLTRVPAACLAWG